jgi:hypothetical protein
MTDDELDVFAPKPPPPPPRTSMPVSRRDWTSLEDLALWPAVVPRGSKADYTTACRWLCDTFNRVPLTDPRDHDVRAVALVEMRVVTRHLETASDELVRLARDLLGGYRAGLPLSWVERNEILLPYARKLENGRARVPLETVFALLGRNDADDGDLVRDYLHVIEWGGADTEGTADPVPDYPATARLAQRASSAPAPSVWGQYVRACQGRGETC